MFFLECTLLYKTNGSKFEKWCTQFVPDTQPPDVTHNTAQSRRMTAADRVNRYNQSRQSSASDDNMGNIYTKSLSIVYPFNSI